MWIVAEYEATTFFSLKPATATTSGGRTLLVPTPFAVKMALLDVACRVDGQGNAKTAWEWLGTLSVALRPPPEIVINNTFIKILKERRNAVPEGSQDAGFFGKTIAYREYAQISGPFGIALETDVDGQAETLRRWLLCINYLGKRGSFIQILTPPSEYSTLPEGFLVIDGELDEVPLNAILTQLDDIGDNTSFDHVNVYSGKRIRLGRERILRHVALPYRLEASSRGYSHYQRTDQ